MTGLSVSIPILVPVPLRAPLRIVSGGSSAHATLSPVSHLTVGYLANCVLTAPMSCRYFMMHIPALHANAAVYSASSAMGNFVPWFPLMGFHSSAECVWWHTA